MKPYNPVFYFLSCFLLIGELTAQPITNGLIAHYPFSGNANDISGNGFHGIVNGPIPTMDRFGNANSAYQFDGVNDFISVTDNMVLDIGLSNYTLVAWIKTANNNAGRIFSKGSFNCQTGYMMRTGGSSASKIHLENAANSNCIINFDGNVIIDDNTWHCIVGVVNRDSFARIYVDGVLDRQVNINSTGFNFSNNLNLIFGADNALNAEFFSGSLDDIGIFNRAISPGEVAVLYASSTTPGDNCSNAINLATLTSPYQGTTLGAANDFALNCVGNALDKIFYIDVPTNHFLTIGQTINNYDSENRLAYGSACPGENLIQCWDEPDLQSNIWHNTTGATQRVWWIQDAYSSDGGGSFTLAWDVQLSPVNDLCINATPISCGQTISGSTLLASVDNAPFCVDNMNSANGVWYQFVGSGAETTASLCSFFNYDTKIGVYSGSCSNLVCITGEDDFCGLGSEVTFQTQFGETYYIIVTGYNSYTGNFNLRLTCDIALNNDIAPTQLINPITSCSFSQPQQVTIEITNHGINPQSNFQVGYILNGNTTTAIFPGTIQPGASSTFTFPQTINLNAVGSYNFQLFTALSGDQNPLNNQISAVIQHLPPLNIQITGQTETCPNGYVALQTEYNPAYQYQWSNGSSSFFTTAFPTQTTTYTVTVTDTDHPGCTDVASSTVVVLTPPVTPTIFASQSYLCGNNPVTISVVNLSTGNLLWNTGQTGPSISVNQPGYYRVTHVAETGCSASSQWIYIGAAPTPSVFPTGDGIICGQDSETLWVSFGESYLWSTEATTENITVMPTATTTYSVTVTTEYNCTHVLNFTVQVASNAPPGTSIGLLPPDGAQNIALPVQLSWQPAANATHYDIYLWEEAGNQPVNPTITTTQIAYFYGNLQYGKTYKWRVCARNACSGAAATCSIVQKFTLNYLPDLVPTDITPPLTPFSGTQTELTWKVANTGVGSTQGISSNGYWQDVSYLSIDNILNNGDLYLGAKINPNALLSLQEYTNSLTINLPDGIQGEYYVITCTDRYISMPESNEQNNCSVTPTPINIQLSPYPDLLVEPLPLPAGAAGGIVFPGESYEVNWTVKNRNNGANSGTTLSDWWVDRVYVSEDSIFNIQTATLQATVRHDGNLGVGATYDTSAIIQIPLQAEAPLYFYVCTDISNREYEFAFEDNNCTRSAKLSVIVLPKPDFYVNQISAPDTASNREYITVSWAGGNSGANFLTGSLSHRVYLSDQPDFSGWFTALSNTSLQLNLPFSAPYSGQATVQIPSNRSGKHYLLVRVNPNNSVNESNYNNNLWIDSLVIVSPNLTVAGITPMPGAISGQTVTFEWELSNIGTGDLLGYSVTDRIRLINVADPGQSISLTQSDYLSIFSDGSLLRHKSYAIPNGLTGSYLIEVHTNYNNSAYENGLYGDNVLTAVDTLHIGPANYPNLIANSISSATMTATAGSAVSISFSAGNAGTIPAIGNWSDRVYLSTDDTWPISSFIVLQSVPHSQVVAPGNSYIKTFTAQLPSYLQPGDYYLYLQSDAANSIFETNESDNILRSDLAVSVSVYPVVDLRFDGAPTGPVSLAPGQTAAVNFKVKNDGTVPTLAGSWKDGLYLSPNPTWEPTDLLIASWQRNGALGPGQTYERLENFTLPAGFNSAFYLCLVIDYEQVVNEQNEANNAFKLLQSNGNPVIVTYPPRPDLAPESFNYTTNGVAGQPMTLEYAIRNIDNDGHASGNWNDAVYLSLDSLLGPNDLFLGQKLRTGGLSANGFYNNSLEVTLPLGISGNYFLLLKADAGGGITEENEANNVIGKYIFITQPLPGDLYVAGEEIAMPPLDTIATDLTVSWRLKNIGQNPLSGFMREGIYLSEDGIWDASDALLGIRTGTIGLDPGASVLHTLTARLENVKRQAYYILVKTDLLDHFLEEDENNNCGISLTTVFVEVPELPVGPPVTPANLKRERSIYYRIEIPANLADETMRVTLSSSDNTAFNELYLRWNDIPSRAVHDFSFSAPFSENQEIIIPELAQGTYYLMAYAVEGTPEQDVELLAEIIPFQITAIEANKGGNTGSMTALLKGAKFQPGMRVWLEKAGLGIIEATQVNIISPSRAFVTFPLDGKQTGLYDVKAENTALQLAVLPNGFEIEAGTIGNGPLIASCSMDLGNEILSLNNIPESVEVLSFEPVHPASVRPNQVVSITLRYENTSNIDTPVPARIFTSLNGFPLAMESAGIGENLQELPLLFTEENGPQEVLRPGGVAFRTVYSKATQSQGELKFKLLSN